MGFLSRLFGKASGRNGETQSNSKSPEDDYKVTITAELVRVEHPAKETEEIFWKNITEIKLINTDEGPFLPDVWLALFGENSRCFIPQGAEGYDEVYDTVSKYEDFNFENVIKSMSCAENMEFELWKIS